MTGERADVAAAGHQRNASAARAGLSSPDPKVRGTALGALRRCGALAVDDLRSALTDSSPIVRRRAVELSAVVTEVSILDALRDADWAVAEMAAWAAGEQHEQRGSTDNDVMDLLESLAADHREPLVREAAVAALGAIGDPRSLATVLAATRDKPAIRRRAVIALTPFDGPEVSEALERARQDRDWQVRDAAEELG